MSRRWCLFVAAAAAFALLMTTGCTHRETAKKVEAVPPPAPEVSSPAPAPAPKSLPKAKPPFEPEPRPAVEPVAAAPEREWTLSESVKESRAPKASSAAARSLAHKRQEKRTAPAIQAGSPAGPVESSPYDTRIIDDIISGLGWANIAYNYPPETMRLDDEANIYLKLSLKESMEQLSESIKEKGKKEGGRVRVSNAMEAELAGYGFKIDTVSKKQQVISTEGGAEWNWKITAVSQGRQKLSLNMYALVKVNDTEKPYRIKVYEKEIAIEVTPMQRTKKFVRNNWQWLWAAILAPFGGFIWRGITRRRDSG